jgi:hypothetical protein
MFIVSDIYSSVYLQKKIIPVCRFNEMDPSVSGRGAEPIYRDKKGKEKYFFLIF